MATAVAGGAYRFSLLSQLSTWFNPIQQFTPAFHYNNKLLGTSASLLGARALLVVTRSY